MNGSLAEKIHDCLGISIDPSDVRGRICLNCEYTISFIDEFRNLCLQTEKLGSTRFHSNDVWKWQCYNHNVSELRALVQGYRDSMDDRLDVDKPASSVPGDQLGSIVSPELIKIEQDEIENVELEEENRLESVIEIKEEVITSESVLETIGNVDSLGGTSISDNASRFELKLRVANELEAQKTENPDLNRVSEKLNLKFYVVKKLWQAMRQYYRKNKKLACAGHNASIVRCRECPLFSVMNVLVPKFDGDKPYNEHAPIRTKTYNE